MMDGQTMGLCQLDELEIWRQEKCRCCGGNGTVVEKVVRVTDFSWDIKWKVCSEFVDSMLASFKNMWGNLFEKGDLKANHVFGNVRTQRQILSDWNPSQNENSRNACTCMFLSGWWEKVDKIRTVQCVRTIWFCQENASKPLFHDVKIFFSFYVFLDCFWTKMGYA